MQDKILEKTKVGMRLDDRSVIIYSNYNANLNMNLEVTKLIKFIGVPAHIKGYRYIRDSIYLMLVDYSIFDDGITKSLYPTIAKKHKKTPSSVERAIRYAIEVAWQRGNIKKIIDIFGDTVAPNKGKPTNGEFLAMVVDYIKIKLEI